ncbi:hypothetical protein AA637_13470 [Cyanobacterium sp. HL-69]|uniref:YciI family protein n=1 Tax=Cyanobacterium sp. HL-69 TaxID=2054282 RepID=UPI000CA32ACD|nr:hypothetical protein AA637_13470 [Cyanobacterium sp. HL-69]
MAWFVKIERGIVPKHIFDKYVPAHLEYVKELNKLGHEAKTGYWNDDEGGMLIFKADCIEEAKTIVEKDPLIQNKCVEYVLHQWCIVN